jgi:hypothetical protein
MMTSPPNDSPSSSLPRFQNRSGRKNRHRKHQRASEPTDRPTVDLQPWDFDVFRFLDTHRLATTTQLGNITPLWPSGKGQARTIRVVQRRLQRLFQAGYLDQPPVQLAHRLTGQLYTRDTIHALGYHGHLALYGNDAKGRADRLRRANEALVTLQHTVGVTEVAVMFQRAATTERLDIEWLTTPAFQARYRLKDVKIERPTKTGALNETLPIAPDGFAIVGGQHYFIEFDCATEPIERSTYRRSALEKKFEAYWQLYKTRTNQEHDLPGFQVLTVLAPYRVAEDIDRRLLSALTRAGDIRPGGKSQFFLCARFSDLLAVGDDILRRPTWISAGSTSTYVALFDT